MSKPKVAQKPAEKKPERIFPTTPIQTSISRMSLDEFAVTAEGVLGIGKILRDGGDTTGVRLGCALEILAGHLFDIHSEIDARCTAAAAGGAR